MSSVMAVLISWSSDWESGEEGEEVMMTLKRSMEAVRTRALEDLVEFTIWVRRRVKEDWVRVFG
jgi:hypothetical protein